MQQTYEKGVRAKASKIGTEDKQAEGRRRSSSESCQNCIQTEGPIHLQRGPKLSWMTLVSKLGLLPLAGGWWHEWMG